MKAGLFPRGSTYLGALAASTLLAACAPEDMEDVSERGASAEAADADSITAEDGSFEGHFETHILDFSDGTSATHHVLTNGRTHVVLDVSPEDRPDVLQRGALVKAFGEVGEGRKMTVDELQLVTPPPQKIIDPEKREPRRVAFIMVHWGSPDNLSKEEAKDRVFTGNSSTNTHYQEISYGSEKVAGDPYGWFEIPDPGNCADNYDAIATDGKAALQASGVNIYQFNQFMFYFPSDGSCGFGGLGSSGDPDDPSPNSWYNGQANCVTLTQELGHNFGMAHSNSLKCVDGNGNDTPWSDDCNGTAENPSGSIEYGDPYDPMGSGCGHMNVYQKGYMGWLEQCNDVVVTQDGTFNLLPTELPCNGIQSVRIKVDTNQYYLLEYRQPLGAFDGGQSGVLVHEAPGYQPNVKPNILDMAIGAQGMFMHAGESYDDHLGRASFSITEENGTHAVVSVTFPGGGAGGPECLDKTTPPTEGGNFGSLECATEPVPHDGNPPTVAITSPEDGANIEFGVDFMIAAEAADDNGLTELQLYQGNTPSFKLFEEPWEWTVKDLEVGSYQFGVAAKDGPNLTPSELITINIVPAGGSTGTGGTTDGGTMSGSTGGGTDSDTGPDQTTNDGGCSCSTTAPAPTWSLLGVCLALGFRRRR